MPPMPRNLTREGRKAWKRLAPELVRYNLLSKVDADGFGQLCRTIGRLEVLENSFRASQEHLLSENKDPALAFVAHTPNGLQVQSGLYQVLNRESEKLRGLLAEFGLTPAQRARVTTAIRAQLQLFDGGAGGEAAKPAESAGFAGFE